MPLCVGLQRGVEICTSNADTQDAKIGQVPKDGVFVVTVRSDTTDCVEHCF